MVREVCATSTYLTIPMSSADTRFKQLARALPSSPHDDDLIDLAEALAAAAATAVVSPGRKAALLVRHHVLGKHGDGLATRVREMACSILADRPQPTPAPVPEPTWVLLPEAAVILGLPERYVLARIHDRKWRRAWGWPRWVGPGRRDWMFARAAIDGATAGHTLLALPDDEPPYPLPEWCQPSD